MSYLGRRWLIGLGACGVAGASVLGAAGAVGAAGATAAAASSARQSSNAINAHAAVATACTAYTPSSRTLRFGSHGPAVKALQERLRCLHYFAGRADGTLGWDTLEGVWAFKEVQSGKIEPQNASIVGSAMQRQLLHPRLPKVLFPHGGSNFRIEINKRIEVLVLYHHNKVELITHVSSGGGYHYCTSGGCGVAVTPDGHYSTLSFLAGNITVPLGQMFNPVFFIGRAFAIHGEPNGEVPIVPVSHGCVRIPWDLAIYFHTLIRIPGTPVFITG